MIDTVAWVHLENGRILCARPRGKGVFYVPGGKREGAESDLQTLLREITEELNKIARRRMSEVRICGVCGLAVCGDGRLGAQSRSGAYCPVSRRLETKATRLTQFLSASKKSEPI